MNPSHDELHRAMNYLNASIEQLSDDSVQYYYFGLVPAHRDNLAHQHSFFESCYVYKGEGLYLERDKSYDLRAGCFFLSRPGIIHQITNGKQLGLFYVAYRINETAPVMLRSQYHDATNSAHIGVEQAQNLSIAWLWQALASEAAYAEDDTLPTIRSLCQALIGVIPKHITNPNRKKMLEESIHTMKEHSIHLQQAKLYIQDNFNRPIRLEEVANYLYISPRHLSRLFQKSGEGTFTQYLQQVRLAHASHLLTDHSNSIKSIAEVCGFGSVHYFTRVFTSKIGVSPAQYRNKNKEEL